MRCCFVAEMAHALLVLLIIRLLFIITALQMALLVCLVPALALELLFELLFALELLFIIRPHGAVEFLSCFVAEMLLFMELLCCKWCALLVGVRCWLSAGYQRVLAILY